MNDVRIGTRTITQTRFFPAKPSDVYEAFMNPKKHSEFTGAKASGKQRVGGTFSAWDGYITARNLKLVKGKMIVQEWITTDWKISEPPSILELTLSARGGGTVLRMIHSRIPSRLADSYREGWPESYWIPLKEYFEKRKNTR